MPELTGQSNTAKTMEKRAPEKDFEEEEDMEEEDEDDGEEGLQIHAPDDGEKDGKKKGKKSGRTSLSGRGVTLKMLLDDGVLAVEEGCMSIDYLVRIVLFCLQKQGCTKYLTFWDRNVSKNIFCK